VGLDGFCEAKDAQTWSEAEWSEKAPGTGDLKVMEIPKAI